MMWKSIAVGAVLLAGVSVGAPIAEAELWEAAVHGTVVAEQFDAEHVVFPCLWPVCGLS
ncbi:hypothetical protein ACFQZZ_13175 [Nocardia sp. GCM10030253]|uniref:hypothetical protein n=1 Tax=Nocardia sp. GCM10030253 TaxID=3273404 RepID=UPI0036271C43